MRLDIAKSMAASSTSKGVLKYFIDHQTSAKVLVKQFDWDAKSLLELLVKRNNIWTDLPRAYQFYVKSLYHDFDPN